MSGRDPVKTAQQHQEFARAYVGGATLKFALVQAGYSPAQARKGMAIVNRSKGLRQAIAACGRLLVELGGNVTAQQQQNLVRGRLILNTIRGSDAGTSSAKVLGSEKRVSMWQNGMSEGFVTIGAPKAALHDKEGLLQEPSK